MPLESGPSLKEAPPTESGVFTSTFPPSLTEGISIPEMLIPRRKLWKGGFELGLNGSEGNSRTFNLRFGFDAKRTTKQHVLALDLDYQKNSSDSVETANRLFLDGRWERLFEKSPWTWFVHGTTEYDEFKAFDVRLSFDTGLGYRFIETKSTLLLGRFGGGFSHEIGGPDDSYTPEAIFGLEGERQLTKRQKLTASVEYTPDITQFDEYRINSKVGWEVLLDEEMNLNLKLSILDRYDSAPHGGDEANDLDYSAVLLWKF